MAEFFSKIRRTVAVTVEGEGAVVQAHIGKLLVHRIAVLLPRHGRPQTFPFNGRGRRRDAGVVDAFARTAGV